MRIFSNAPNSNKIAESLFSYHTCISLPKTEWFIYTIVFFIYIELTMKEALFNILIKWIIIPLLSKSTILYKKELSVTNSSFFDYLRKSTAI